ncbi:hypothetical protein FRC11_010353 [Ceratobasidium sp. 423]|nr:hypothetical protein FRC11_010353 [Ceratobasidium sp. 423]
MARRQSTIARGCIQVHLAGENAHVGAVVVVVPPGTPALAPIPAPAPGLGPISPSLLGSLRGLPVLHQGDNANQF